MVYHFHDTSFTSPMRGDCNINDNECLRDNGSNLAAYLYYLMQNDENGFSLYRGCRTFPWRLIFKRALSFALTPTIITKISS